MLLLLGDVVVITQSLAQDRRWQRSYKPKPFEAFLSLYTPLFGSKVQWSNGQWSNGRWSNVYIPTYRKPTEKNKRPSYHHQPPSFYTTTTYLPTSTPTYQQPEQEETAPTYQPKPTYPTLEPSYHEPTTPAYEEPVSDQTLDDIAEGYEVPEMEEEAHSSPKPPASTYIVFEPAPATSVSPSQSYKPEASHKADPAPLPPSWPDNNQAAETEVVDLFGQQCEVAECWPEYAAMDGGLPSMNSSTVEWTSLESSAESPQEDDDIPAASLELSYVEEGLQEYESLHSYEEHDIGEENGNSKMLQNYEDSNYPDTPTTPITGSPPPPSAPLQPDPRPPRQIRGVWGVPGRVTHPKWSEQGDWYRPLYGGVGSSSQEVYGRTQRSLRNQRNQRNKRNKKTQWYQRNQRNKRYHRNHRNQRDQRKQRNQRKQRDQRKQRNQRNLWNTKNQRNHRNQRYQRNLTKQRKQRNLWN